MATPTAISPSPLEQLLSARREFMRRGDYDVLGNITLAQTAKGKIDFKQNGPTLALPKGELDKPWEQVDFSTLLIVSPWEAKLPDLLEASDEFCPDCLTTCDECRGKGKRACNWAGCYGRGQVDSKIIECRASGCAKDTGKTNPECTACGGTGMAYARNKCKGCRGTGEMECGLCRGTGKYPTGIHGGRLYKRGAKNPDCKTCAGNRRVGKSKPQDWRKFVEGVLENKYFVLGPILFLHVERGGRMTSLDFEILADHQGRYLSLILESPKAGSRMYALGGVAKQRV